MAEYIEREALIKQFCERCNEEMSEIPCEPSECFAREVIIGVPAVDVAPVRHGRWIPEFPLLGNNSLFFKCSVCGFETTGGKQYCTRCFTKMDLEDEDHG